MRVLVACEESQTVCAAFRARGHEAYSCDIQTPSGGHPEWHILGDALNAIRAGVIVTMDGVIETMDGVTHDIPRWDLLIAHPPCTYLANSSAVRLFDKNHRIKDHLREIKGWAARDFFFAMLLAPIDRIAVENPVPLKYFHLPPYTQIIEPYQYGEPWKKRTCLWLENLPDLRPTKIVEPQGLWVGSCGGRDKEKRKLMTKYMLKSQRSQKQRSKTFPGIAAAMAEQWGNLDTGDGADENRKSDRDT